QGPVMMNGPLAVRGGLTVQGSATMNGLLTAGGGLMVTGNAQVNGGIALTANHAITYGGKKFPLDVVADQIVFTPHIDHTTTSHTFTVTSNLPQVSDAFIHVGLAGISNAL